MEVIIKIVGQLKFIVFEGKNGFRICKFQLLKGNNKNLTIKGNLGTMINNVDYEVTGSIVNDKKYGETFIVQSFTPVTSNNSDQLIKYFSSNLFPTIGKRTATTLVNYLKPNVLETIKDDYDVLFTVPNLSHKHANIIKQVLINSNDDTDLYHQFNINNLSQEILTQLKKKYAVEKIKEILHSDPYELLLKWKFNFYQIDKVFLAFNVEKSLSILRIAYFSWNLVNKICQQTGNTYTDLPTLYQEILKIFPNLLREIFLESLMYIKNKNYLIFKDNKIFDSLIYQAELDISDFLKTLNNEKNYFNYQDILLNNNFFNFEQQQAITNALSKNVSIIIGGPGTGKTTVVKGLIDNFKQYCANASITLVAPTGKAAKRLREQTKYSASTIHKMLHYDIENDEFYYNISNPLECDILIIDEASMVDIKIFAAIINAGARIKKLVLIGDLDQLPSVGCGKLLSDLITSNLFAVTKLEKVYRQVAGNDILTLCKAIVTEEPYNFLNDSNDLFFYDNNDNNKILEKILQLYQDNSFATQEETYQKLQIIAPMYKGAVGINALNFFLQEKLNYLNQDCKIQIGTNNFWLYDKVMQLKNRPELNIYNGDVGIVVKIETETINDKKIYVKFDDNIVEYNHEMLYELTLAYACSVHKLQGSEYEKVIFVLTNASWIMLYKNLIYTGVSRAKTKLFLVGELSAFKKGIAKKTLERQTMLDTFLLS